ncbi:hypothetical protein ABIB40_002227 [Pedobacter sp. UYP30]
MNLLNDHHQPPNVINLKKSFVGQSLSKTLNMKLLNPKTNKMAVPRQALDDTILLVFS